MNVNLYGCRGQWIMVDLGLTFANADYPGIDLILPDLDFIEKHQDRLAGIVLTHGHEDHIGALPYLGEDLKSPLYATPFTAGLIAGKLEEEGLTGRVKLNIVERGGAPRARAVQGELRRAVAFDSRGQRSSDRNAVRQHLPHRRLEDRRHAGARRSAQHRSPDRHRRPGRAGAGLRLRPTSFRTRPRAPRKGCTKGCGRRSRRHPAGCSSPPSRPTPLGCRRSDASRSRPTAACASPAVRSTGSCGWRRRPAI